jgi:hypothetical protein
MRRPGTLVLLLTAIMLAVAGTAVVALAASLTVSVKHLGAEQVALPTCSDTSVTYTEKDGDVTKVEPTLSSCSATAKDDHLYVVLKEATDLGYGDCELTTSPYDSCTVTLTGTVPYSATDSYSLAVIANPAAAGAASTSANDLSLASDYLTVASCSTTRTGPPATCS